MSHVVLLQNVSKEYRVGEIDVHALKNIKLSLRKKEFTAIIGPSGSGKSTLMHLIGLLDRPTAGKIFLEGKEISKLNEEKIAELRNRHIGFVFQSFNLLPKTSALSNVELPLIYSHVTANERTKRAKEALAQVGLSDRLNHFPNQLSGGQQQRVAIARALVTDPSIILADEPTGNLDSKSGKEIIELLTKLNKKGNTVVLVTHDIKLAKAAKRVVELKDGKIIRDTQKK